MATRATTRGRRVLLADPDESKPAIGLPTFSPPIGRGETPTDETDEVLTTGPTLPLDGAGGSWRAFGGDALTGPSTTRTATSSDDLSTGAGTSKAETARNAGVLLAGLLTIVAGGVAVVLSRAGRRLRRPSREETRAVARPVARILVRHVPADMITADLADAAEAAAAASDYLSAGPVAPRVAAVQHIGYVPPDEADDTPRSSGSSTAVPEEPSGAEAMHNALNLDMQPTALGDPGPTPNVSYLQ